MLWHQGLNGPGLNLSSTTTYFPEIVKIGLTVHLLYVNPSTQSSHLHLPPLLGSHWGPLFFWPNHPGPRTRQIGTTHLPHSIWLTPVLPSMATLPSVACPLFLGTLNNKIFFFNGKCLLISCWPYLTWIIMKLTFLKYDLGLLLINVQTFKIYILSNYTKKFKY